MLKAALRSISSPTSAGCRSRPVSRALNGRESALNEILILFPCCGVVVLCRRTLHEVGTGTQHRTPDAAIHCDLARPDGVDDLIPAKLGDLHRRQLSDRSRGLHCIRQDGWPAPDGVRPVGMA